MNEQVQDALADIEEIECSLRELHKCQMMGRYDLMDLNKWLELHPDEIWKDLERLRNRLVEINDLLQSHGNVHTRYHQAV